MSALTGRLSAAEVDFLAQCEDTIAEGLHTFVEVGTALAAVRDNRLYRAAFLTFDDYCAMRWGFTDSRARQLISAAMTVTNVTAAGLPAPANEGQARELARVPEGQRAEVWAETVERTGGKPTAAAIRETAESKTPARRDLEPNPPGPAVATPGESAEPEGVAVSETDAAVISSTEPEGVAPEAEGTSGAASSTEPPAGPSAVAVHSDRPGLAEQTELARWQAGFLAQVHAVHKVLRYPVADVVAMADDECLSELRRVVQLATRYLDDIDTLARAELPANVTPIRRAQ